MIRSEHKRKTNYVTRTLNPVWNHTSIYKNIHRDELKNKTLELAVWDWDRFTSNDYLGVVNIDLSGKL